MAWKPYGAGFQYTGFPALIFLALKDMGTRSQSIADRLNTLVHIFAYIRAVLPERNNTDDPELEKLFNETDQEIKTAREQYKATFEEEATYSPEENQFLIILDGILYREAEIIARAKLIDNQRLESVEAPAG